MRSAADTNDRALEIKSRVEHRSRLIEEYRAEHRNLEITSSLKAKEGFIGIRLDGRSFHTLTADYKKPFDVQIERAMEKAAEAVLKDLSDAICAYVQSDEITVILPPHSQLFDRRLEKLLTISASLASVDFSLELGRPAQFDARYIHLPSEEHAMAVIQERIFDSQKNAVSTVLFYYLLQSGMSKRTAAKKMMEIGSKRDRVSFLADKGINLDEIPKERKNGRLLVRKEKLKEGYNPITKEKVMARRRVLEWERDIGDFRTLERLPGYKETPQGSMARAYAKSLEKSAPPSPPL